MKKVVCGCVVMKMQKNDIEILLVSDDGEEWGLPKGGVKPGEELEAAAIRETLEETSIEVRIVGYAGFYDRMHAWYALPAEKDMEPIPQKGEIIAAGYFSIDNLPKIEDQQIPLLSKALERLRIAARI